MLAGADVRANGAQENKQKEGKTARRAHGHRPGANAKIVAIAEQSEALSGANRV